MVVSYKEGKQEMKKLILSAYPLIFVVTQEERPVIETVVKIAENNHRRHHVYSWNRASGMIKENGNDREDIRNPIEVFRKIKNTKENSIFILHDFHLYLKDNENLLQLKDLVKHITLPMTNEYLQKRYEDADHAYYKTIVITSPEMHVPKEIDKLMSVVHFGYPGKEEIRSMLEIIIGKSEENKMLTEKEKEKIVEASIGLTETEIFNAYTKSMIINSGKIDSKAITQEKKQIIQKSGLMEYYEPKTGLGEVGGMKNLIEWVKKRKVAFQDEVRVKRKLEYPKGLLMTGIQGCGKSHSVKAISNYLEMPLIRLDVGAMMNKWVGESEKNLRDAINLAENISPCVLWVDEIDKAIPSATSDNSHEVTKRLLSTLLTWLQEKEKPVFVVATANNIHHLPPELMRKGRFDELFFIDLPKSEERIEILKIHLKKRGFDIDSIDLLTISQATEGFSGSELEVLINEANFQSAYDGEMISTDYLLREVRKTNPLSVTMKDKIEEIQNWAKSRNIRCAN